jgi:anti-anti-sigma factor
MEVERTEGVTIVRFTKPAIMEEKVIEVIGDELTRLVERLGNVRLVLDFSKVAHVGSYMLSLLVNLHKKTQAGGGGLALSGICPDLLKVLELTKLTQVLSIFPDEVQARQSLPQT